MIKVTRKDYTLAVDGHAGFAEKGHDIVCAAASILFFSLYNSIAERDIAYSSGTTGDHIEITAMPPKEFTLDTDVVFETICTGYRMLAEEYPEHVTFTDES